MNLPRVSLSSLIFLALMVPASYGRAQVSDQMTPLLLAVQDAPVPFMGSDGRVHLVYELEMTNFSSAEILVEKVEVLGDGVCLPNSSTLLCSTSSARRYARIGGNARRERAGATLSQRRACSGSQSSRERSASRQRSR